MGDLSENFSRHEFACKDGCGFDTVDSELIMLCEYVRWLEGNPITPNSGCRCSEHNFSVGGSDTSQHTKGRAADLPVTNPSRTYDALCNKFHGKYGFGLYEKQGFVHVDSRTNGPARWTKN